MTTAQANHTPFHDVDEQTYRRRIRAWVLYDWANSAFVTTVLAAMLPAYYSSVAGATLPSEATATGYWSLTLSIALFISALLSPILGTVSDVMRGKKRFFTIFLMIGVIATGFMVLINTGDWLLASLLLIFGRVGFSGAIIFYDAFLPHIARPEDQDIVSTRGYAMGYLGGGLLLAINVAMFMFIPDSLFEHAGIRLSFLSVAVWWLLFSIPLLRNVPEPPAATAALKPGETVIGVSFKRLKETFGDIRRYSELFKYLVAFLIYNDAIGTIIGVAVIYGAELGFGTLELVLALLLVQFVGIPFSLIFGRLPGRKSQRRSFYLAFILFNLVALPLVGIIGSQALPEDVAGRPPAPFESTAAAYGEGVYGMDEEVVTLEGDWSQTVVSGDELIGEGALASISAALAGRPDDAAYAFTESPDARLTFRFNGQTLELTHSVGPDHGILAVELDGKPLMETITEDGQEVERPLTLDLYNETLRYNETFAITAPEVGEHTLTLVNTGEANPQSNGTRVGIAKLTVLPPSRVSSLPVIMGILLALQALGLVFAYLTQRFFTPLADKLDTRRSILLALLVYCAISIWGFFLSATIEFWFLAWMVAVVQGGSQALSRSLYASMCPSAKSGEFFGLYSIMEKFASIIGPLLFALAVAAFDSSRPAILSLIALFVIGGYLLTRVDIEKGQQVAREEDAAIYGAAAE